MDDAVDDAVDGYIEYIAELCEQRDALVEALEAAFNGGGWGHSHWDSTMQYGVGCKTCIEQRTTRKILGDALSAVHLSAGPVEE